MMKVGWFTSGRGSGSRAMLVSTLQAIEQGVLDAEIEFIFMHREFGEGDGSDDFIKFVNSLGIPLVSYSYKNFVNKQPESANRSRADYDDQVKLLLKPYTPDICVLAGYLLILSKPMTEEFKFINLHGALPGGPVGLWQSVIWDLILNHSKESGINVFLVTPDLDRGPSISFCKFDLSGPMFDSLWQSLGTMDIAAIKEHGVNQPLFKLIREEGLRREPLILVETINHISKSYNDLSLLGSFSPVDLTTVIDSKISIG